MKQSLCLACIALLLCSCKKKELGAAPLFSFNIDKFEQNIKATYSGQTAGFSYAISTGDQVKKYGAWGNSRLGDDGVELYTPETRQHIFSVSKFITAVAICKALKSLNKTLDEKVSKYLPSSWTIHSDYDDLTFKDLLAHKSGFTVGTDYYNTLKDMMSKPKGSTSYNYNNSNFTLCRILLPYLRYERNWIEQQDNPEAVTAVLFRAQVRDLVLQPSGLTYWELADFKDWTHVNAAGYRAPRYYVMDKPDLESVEYGDYLIRSGAGAHVLSAYEVAQVLKAYASKKLLPQDWMDQMKANGCGFDGAGLAGEHGTYYWKNGGLGDTEGRGGEALIMVFPYDVQVCIMANSNRAANDQFVGNAALMAKAYDDAW